MAETLEISHTLVESLEILTESSENLVATYVKRYYLRATESEVVTSSNYYPSTRSYRIRES